MAWEGEAFVRAAAIPFCYFPQVYVVTPYTDAPPTEGKEFHRGDTLWTEQSGLAHHGLAHHTTGQFRGAPQSRTSDHHGHICVMCSFPIEKNRRAKRYIMSMVEGLMVVFEVQLGGHMVYVCE